MATYDNKLLDGEHLVYYTQKVKTELAGKQPTIDSSHKLDYALLSNTPTIPSAVSDLTNDEGFLNADNFIQGSGISITEDSEGNLTIANTNSAAAWGNITGTLSNQTDLANALAAKQDALTAGANVSIATDAGTGNLVISATDTTYVFNTAYNASTNKAATMSDITTAISGLTGFHFEIVQVLPTEDIETNCIYLVLKSSGSTGNIYTEYAYINNNWEILGDTQLDLEVLSNADIDSIWSAATPSNS